MVGIPRYRPYLGPVALSAGFRPFFLASSIWAAIGIPLWLAVYGGETALPSRLQPLVWHVHEMVYGFAAATVAGFLLTAIPNWTGRMPLQGRPLALLVLLWALGRAGIMLSGIIGAPAAAVTDLSFPVAFLAVVAREIITGRNWRNLPMLAALSALLVGNALVHCDALGIGDTAEVGNRVGIATLLLLVSLVGGRITPSFTRNWLTKKRPEVRPPHAEDWLDRTVLFVTALALAAWTVGPDGIATAWATIIAGIANGWRMSRWQGHMTIGEPLLFILHAGYAWLTVGLLLLGCNVLFGFLPLTTALHALTIGAIGTMTLAVMTRASLGHTGRPLVAGPLTCTIYLFVSLSALLRILSPLAGSQMMPALWTAGTLWMAAFGLFALLYGVVLMRPRAGAREVKPI